MMLPKKNWEKFCQKNGEHFITYKCISYNLKVIKDEGGQFMFYYLRRNNAAKLMDEKKEENREKFTVKENE